MQQVAMAEYNRNGTLKHMITKIRRDPRTFERWGHARQLQFYCLYGIHQFLCMS